MIKTLSKIKLQTYSLVALFLIIPFFNILKLKAGNDVAYVVVGFFFFVSFGFFRIENKINFQEKALILPALMVITMCMSALYHVASDGSSHIFYILYYGSSVFVFFAFLTCYLDEFLDKYFLATLKFSFLFFCTIIIIDYILIALDVTESQLLYGTRATSGLDGSIRHNNILRPLGAFGQATVNGVLVAFLYFLIKAVDRRKIVSRLEFFFYLFLLIFSVVLQGGGTVFISFFLSLFLISIYQLRWRSLLLLFSTFSAFLWLFYQFDFFISSRLSGEYVSKISLIFFNEISELFFRFDNIGELLFGVGGIKASTNFQELMPAKFIYQMGLIMFILYVVWFLILLFKSPNNYYRLAILLLIIGSQHYEAMFRAYNMIFIMPMLYYLILFDKKKPITR